MRAFTTIHIMLLLAFIIHIGLGIPTGMDVTLEDSDSHDCTEAGTCDVVDCINWSYPCKNWQYTCPSFCNGTKQSPIDICCSSTITVVGTLNISSYTNPIEKISIKNNGHTVGASWDSSLPSRTMISGGGLPCNYTLTGFHFHWGCRNNRGSEHTINGTRYAMELHFVHYKTIYGNLSEALKHEDGLAVLGVLFTVGAENSNLKPITDSLPEVIAAGSEKEVDFNMALINLIPTTRTFYRYQGSLTTPTCNEVVIWSVFSTPLSFSEEQAKAFRKLNGKEGHEMCDNYRGIQPLNGREVNQY